MGFGPSAHSYIKPSRYWNCRSVKTYIEDLNTGKIPVEGKEILSKEQRMIEAICVGLRKTEGIDIDIFNKKFGVSFNRIFGEIINNLKEKGYIQFAQNRCALSIKGMLFLDSITSMFVSPLP
jgi:oxygen-independent coproporphyrinogen-3 oxidase